MHYSQIPDTVAITTPLFCPNHDCPHHHSDANDPSWYQRHGTHHSACYGSIQRFRCRHCRTTCSTQTFSFHYWTQRHINPQQIETMLTSSAGQRQIAASISASCRLVQNRCRRLARSYLAAYYAALQDYTISEDCAFDGFETFVRSQYFPVNWNILIGSHTQAVYGVTGVIMRRKGRMTEHQRACRDMIDQHSNRPRAAVRSSCVRLFADLSRHIRLGSSEHPWVLCTDEHRAYPPAFKRVQRMRRALEQHRMIHVTVSSRKRRDGRNLLFPVNYIDREIRKDMGDHARETVKYPREMNLSAQRLIIEMGRHTFCKPIRITNRIGFGGMMSHADAAGLTGTERVRLMLSRRYTHRFVHSRAAADEQIGWIDDIWLERYENPPVIQFSTGKRLRDREPGCRWQPQHLLV